MPDTAFERGLILYFRLAIGWTFLYAASHQVFVADFSIVGFLGSTKTFHDFFAVFATPTLAPITSFLVAYGHLLIGLSLITGFMVRISASFGIMLMLTYWMAHMDWPYISNTNNFIIDYHLIYVGVLAYLIYKHAGHVWGIDGWIASRDLLKNMPGLKPLVA